MDDEKSSGLYLISGHGSFIPDDGHFIVDPQSKIIVQATCGMEVKNTNFIKHSKGILTLNNSVLRNPSRFISNIVKHIDSLGIYEPGMTCPNFRYDLVGYIPINKSDWYIQIRGTVDVSKPTPSIEIYEFSTSNTTRLINKNVSALVIDTKNSNNCFECIITLTQDKLTIYNITNMRGVFYPNATYKIHKRLTMNKFSGILNIAHQATKNEEDLFEILSINRELDNNVSWEYVFNIFNVMYMYSVYPSKEYIIKLLHKIIVSYIAEILIKNMPDVPNVSVVGGFEYFEHLLSTLPIPIPIKMLYWYKSRYSAELNKITSLEDIKYFIINIFLDTFIELEELLKQFDMNMFSKIYDPPKITLFSPFDIVIYILNRLKDKTITQKELCTTLPGVYYHFICRNIKYKNKLQEENYNRRSSSLNKKQKHLQQIENFIQNYRTSNPDKSENNIKSELSEFFNARKNFTNQISYIKKYRKNSKNSIIVEENSRLRFIKKKVEHNLLNSLKKKEELNSLKTKRKNINTFIQEYRNTHKNKNNKNINSELYDYITARNAYIKKITNLQQNINSKYKN